jgi:hypothetical protein
MPPLRGPVDSPTTLRGFWQLSGEAPLRRPQGASHTPALPPAVTGSRTWDDTAVIGHALAVILARHPEGVQLVHGACPRAADAIAAAYAARTPG